MIAALPLPTLELPFPDATGKGLKIAVIDSGVNLNSRYLRAKTHQVNWDDRLNPDGTDQLGHGTLVIATIQERAPEAEYFSLRLFGHSMRATSTRLLRAIDWALVNRMDVINLSMGTPNPDARAGLEILLTRARFAGTVVVSAKKNVGGRCYLPGNLDGAVGVQADWRIDCGRYRISGSGDSPLISASGHTSVLSGMELPGIANGVDFAVANATGFIARACEGLRDRSLERVQEAMAWEASRLSS